MSKILKWCECVSSFWVIYEFKWCDNACIRTILKRTPKNAENESKCYSCVGFKVWWQSLKLLRIVYEKGICFVDSLPHLIWINIQQLIPVKIPPFVPRSVKRSNYFCNVVLMFLFLHIIFFINEFFSFISQIDCYHLLPTNNTAVERRSFPL